MPFRSSGLQGLAEWHLVYLCRSRQRLIASSDPTPDQRTLFQWPAAHHGMRYTQNDPTTHLDRSTDGQAGQARRGPASVLALKLPPGASVLAIGHGRICAADRGQTPGHTYHIGHHRQPDMHLTLLPRIHPHQEESCTEITEIYHPPHPNLGSRPEAPDALAHSIFATALWEIRQNLGWAPRRRRAIN